MLDGPSMSLLSEVIHVAVAAQHFLSWRFSGKHNEISHGIWNAAQMAQRPNCDPSSY